uniref:Uncharacterized protein n=1 Tax=viral metagenome TaxID=1070528 RepID=A0A6C0JXA8_9ZZZZ
MQWATYNSGSDKKKDFRDEEQVYNSYTPQYAGPLRIPPASFQPRVRKETSAIDTTNSRYIENWNTAVPIQQTEYIRNNQQAVSSKQNPDSHVPKSLNTVYMDMAPLSSRTDPRDFRQSQPYIPSGPNLAENPFFDRYDPTRDPKNMVREVRSAVYELQEADRGIQESARLRERTFTDRYEKEGETPTNLTQWFDLLRPKIDNPEIVYRDQTQTWKLGASYNDSGKP